MSRAARDEYLVGAQAYGFDIGLAMGDAVGRRRSVDFLDTGHSLLDRVSDPPPRRSPAPLSHRSHLFQ